MVYQTGLKAVGAIEIIGLGLINAGLSNHINSMIEKDFFESAIELSRKYINDVNLIKERR